MSKTIDDEILIFNTLQDIRAAIGGISITPGFLPPGIDGSLSLLTGMAREVGDHNQGVDLLVLPSSAEIPRISVDENGDEFFFFDAEHAVEPLYQATGFIRFELATVEAQE